MNDKEIIKIVQAHIDGEEIEQRSNGAPAWEPFNEIWMFSSHQYRIALRKPLEYWVNVYGESKTCVCVWDSKEKAMRNAGKYAIHVAVHMREVLEEKEDAQ